MTAYRSIDGTGNNQNFNATATDMTRVGDAQFVDGISEPIETVNPRTVSNNVVGEGDANVPNPVGLSAFMYPWGDASMIYGSTQAVADSLRLPDGHMKVSDGN